jgi:hypothetical protein
MNSLLDRTRNVSRMTGVLMALTAWGGGCSSGVSPSATPEGNEAGGDDAGASAASVPDSGAATDGGSAADGDAHPDEGAAVTTTTVDAASNSDAVATTCSPALPPVTSSSQYLCNPSGAGGCDDCGDCAMVIDGTASTQVASCGTSCVGLPDSCVTGCLSSKSPTLSNSCQSCLATLFNCTTEYCAGPCVTGTQAQCNQCLDENPSPGSTSCNSVFLQCAGLQNNPSYSGQ